MPGKQPKRGRLWLNDGSCIRLRAEGANHVWSYDFVHHRTHDGRAFRMLNVLDEFTRESLAIRVRRKLSSIDVIDLLTDLFILRDELLNGEIFCTLKEAQVLIESRRRHYNAIRPHSSLGYRVPAQDERGARAPPLQVDKGNGDQACRNSAQMSI